MNERALIKRCQSGDKAAFEQLLNEHYDTIYRFAYRWCGDQHNAQDITQQACMKLARAIQSYGHESSFTTWLYRLVINSAKDFYKSPKQHNTREESSEQIKHDETLNAGRNDDRFMQRLYAQQILEHIGSLHSDLCETLILVYGKGMSHSDAAKHLNLKESTISWRIHEARKQLKQTFRSSGLETEDVGIRGTV